MRSWLTNKQGRFASEVTLLTVSNLLPTMTGFITLPIISRYLAPEDYGILALIAAYTTTFAIFVNFQLHSCIPRHIQDYDELGRKEFFSSLMFTVFFISLVYLGLSLYLQDSLVGFFYNTEIAYFPLFLLATLNVVAILFINITNSFLVVEKKASKILISNVVATFVGVIASVWLIVVEDMGVLGSVIGTLLSAICLLLIQLVFVRNNFVVSFRWEAIRSSLIFGVPVIPHALGGYLFMYFDKILLEKWVALAAIGVYSIAGRFSMVYKIFVNSFASVLSPVFMESHKRGGEEGARALIYKVSGIWFPLVGVSYIFFIILSEYVLRVMVPEEYYGAIPLIPFLCLAWVVRAVYIFPINSFYATKKTYWLPVGTLSAGFLNVGLNLIWIPVWGIWGAALATVVAFLFNLLAFEYLSRKKSYGLVYSFGGLGILLCCVCFGNLLFYISYYFFEVWGGFVIRLVVISLLSIILYVMWRKFGKEMMDLMGVIRRRDGF